ncbi:MAG TPA: hypothetical protein PLX89_04685 [Verrucomicrobiota bacterium]|nr:hypothetical protein [Verrucomicrobiota bacterium]
MIVNIWREPPPDTAGLLQMARQRGWQNLPMAANDVRVHWRQEASDALGGVRLERHLPSRQYVAVAPSFDALIEALAWEAGEWIAIEASRARRKGTTKALAQPSEPSVPEPI